MLGLVVARYAERISPVSEDEIMAGESLGMSDGEILTEIVIPSARPGLLQLLNRRTLRFR
jgi:ABC-type nitrate/sulfonate/bicarbonate transport system permease component